MKSVLFIINPHSGKVRKKNIEGIAKQTLPSDLFCVEFVYTKYAGHAPLLAKKGVEEGFDIIVAIGGDGTVHEVAQSLVHTNSALAVIPMGSGNGFARFLKIPLSVKKAIKVIADGKVQKIDAISCNDEYFVNVAGFGFDAKIGHLFAENCDEARGGWNYIKLIVKEYFRYPKQHCIFNINGKEIKKSFFVASVSNSSQYGLDANIDPEADISDGKFELVLVKEMPLFDVIPVTIRLFTNRFHKSRHVETLKMDELVLENTEKRLFHLDGEPRIFDGRITFSMHQHSLKCIIPK